MATKKRKVRIFVWLIVFVLAPATFVLSWYNVLFVTNAGCVVNVAP